MISLLHKLVAIPVIYDLAQWMAGASVTQRALREEFARLPSQGAAVDIGGGTGLLRPLLPATWNYTCVDIDRQKLDGFRKKFPNDNAIEASAMNLPFADNSFDLAVLCAVSHHLTDAEIGPALAEIARILKPAGSFIFLDALNRPDRFRSRMLWAMDRGSNPRTFEQLRDRVSRQFRIERELRYQVHHAYVRWTLQKNPDRPASTPAL